MTEQDIYIADMLKFDFHEDDSLPEAPRGFIKVKDHRLQFVRKSTALFSLYSNRDRVSTDRLRRFINQKKKLLKRDDCVFGGSFIKIIIERCEEYAQVLSFKKLTGTKDHLFTNHVLIADETGKRISNIGVLVNLYKTDSITKKLRFVKPIVEAISLELFIENVDPEELSNLLN